MVFPLGERKWKLCELFGHRRQSRHWIRHRKRVCRKRTSGGSDARSGQGPEGSMTVTADVTDSASLDTAIAEVEAALGPIEVL